ncbi:uncharacterized protein LOC135208682 [Macrobrachium nipponense]|uniref:uncharacterized protein LOC135208682 n=1 Tax=Macrobrachium nipponense TaxID=159736 RepID=UPI0030C7B0E0
MDNCVDDQEFSGVSLLRYLENVNNARDDDSFMDYDPLPPLIRRNSSKRNVNAGSENKENKLSRYPTLLKSKSVPRTNSALGKNRNLFGSFRSADGPLGVVEIGRSSSLKNCDFLKTGDIQDVDKEAGDLGDDISKVSLQVSTEEFTRSTESRTLSAVGLVESAVECTCGESVHQENGKESPEESLGNANLCSDEHQDNEDSHEVTSVQHESRDNTESGHGVNQETEQLTEKGSQFQVDGLQTSANEPVRNCKENEELLSSLSRGSSTKTGDVCSGGNRQSFGSVTEEPKGNNKEVYQAKRMKAYKPMDSTTRPLPENAVPVREINILPSEDNTEQISAKSAQTQHLDTTTEDQSSCQNIQKSSACILSSNQIPPKEQIEDVDSLFQKRNYVKIVLNWLKRVNNEEDMQVTNTGEEPSSILETKSGKECQTSTSKRRASLPSKNSLVVKRAKTLSPNAKSSPMMTRFSKNTLKNQSPNHATSHIAQKKVQLFKAVEEGDLNVTRKLLNHTGPSIRNGKKDNTLLHTAAVSNQIDVFIYLLGLISPNVVNKDGQTPAHVAAAKGHAQILKVLSSDIQFDPDKRDAKQKTFRDLLVAPLFKAVLDGDQKKAKNLLKLGADPDGHAGELVNGVLARELRVTSPRQLANTLHGEQFFSGFPLVCSPKCNNVYSGVMDVLDIDQTGINCGGYVCVLDYQTFVGNPELDRKISSSKVSNLTQLFKKVGYKGSIHTSLSLEETRKTLTSLRDSSALAECRYAVFIISSYGVNKSFLTSDQKVLTGDWVMGLFRNSDCPRLKNKPKLFIFDYDSTCHLGRIDLRREEVTPRVEEPLTNVISLSCENLIGEVSEKYCFLAVLYETLRCHGKAKDIVEVHRDLLKAYTNLGYSPMVEMNNFGFTGKLNLIP